MAFASARSEWFLQYRIHIDQGWADPNSINPERASFVILSSPK